jgi:predicted subunit of tRNA(5-methylaminomethyl-2-thiouridylate) methyltransferase
MIYSTLSPLLSTGRGTINILLSIFYTIFDSHSEQNDDDDGDYDDEILLSVT